MAWNKCYKCKWHTDKCKNQESKNFNKFPDEVVKCNQPIKFTDKLPEGITKQVHKTRKEHTCDFCGRKIYKDREYLANFIFNPDDTIRGKRFLKSCMECNVSMISMFGD